MTQSNNVVKAEKDNPTVALEGNGLGIEQHTNMQLFFHIFPATFFSSFIFMAIGLVNAIMASKISIAAMASLALTGSIMWPLTALSSGFLSIISSKMAYAIGQNRPLNVGEIHRQSYYIIAGTSAVIIAVLLLVAHFVEVLHLDPEMVEIVRPYIYLSCINIPLINLITHLRNLNSCIAYTLPTLYTSILGILLVIPLNNIFMYGHLPLPGDPIYVFEPTTLNPATSAFSHTIIYTGYILLMVIVIKVKKSKYAAFSLFQPLFSKPNGPMLKDTFKVGLPVGIQYWLENSFYGIVAVLLGHLGTLVVAAHETGMIIYGMVYTTSIAVNQTLISISSRRLGERRRDLAYDALRSMVKLVLAINITVGLGIFFFRYEVASILLQGNLEALSIAVNVLALLAISNMFDSLYLTLFGYLVPYRDGKFSMYVIMIAAWCIYMPLACVLAFTDLFGFGKLGIYAFWFAFIAIGITCLTIFTFRIKLLWHRMSDRVLYRRLAKQELDPMH